MATRSFLLRPASGPWKLIVISEPAVYTVLRILPIQLEGWIHRADGFANISEGNHRPARMI